MDVLVVGGNRFVGYELASRLRAGGHHLTLFNRGSRSDPFGERVERLRGDRLAGDFSRLLAGRSFDAVVDFAMFRGEEAAEAVAVLQGRVGHYVMISTGQVYLVREPRPSPARETDYEGPLMAAPASSTPDREEWDYGMGKRAAEDVLVRAWESSRFPSTRLRLPMVNGERDYFRRLEAYLWRLLDGGPLILPDGGERPVRHVYGAAVARAVAALLGCPATFGEAYNLAQDETPTAREVLSIVQPHFVTDYDETQSIGRRYRRQDEAGTPYCITIDFETLDDRAVTVRDRDTLAQDRVSIDKLVDYLRERLPV